VAGRFYPARREALEAELRDYTEKVHEKEKAIGAICPHAGYMYSGAVAGLVYSSILIPDNIVLLGPNHTGYGPAFSLMAEGEWEVPNGVFPINRLLAERIRTEVPFIQKDASAHFYEHSIEVQLPFIAYFRPGATIVPISIMRAGLDELREAGHGLARAISWANRETLIVASSDMSHYVPDEAARKKDRVAIDRVLAMDPEGLYSVVVSERISMCGYLPSVMMLFAAKALGATDARLVKYATSAEVSGDYAQVVGYTGMVVR
jgi:hypothetical protein